MGPKHFQSQTMSEFMIKGNKQYGLYRRCTIGINA